MEELQPILPSIAFEIPIEKHEGLSLPTTIQKKLEELATTPRKAISLEDINKKLDEASKRKQENLVSSKAVTHNAKLLTVLEKTKDEEVEKAKALEEHISSKLSKAEALKEDRTMSWVKKLSRSTKDKLRRGAKVKHSKEWSAKELETKIEIKALAADLRREELKLTVQEELAASNQEKLRRAQLVIDLANAEAKHIELRSDLKLVSAEQRREMNQASALARISEAAAGKKEKVQDLRKQEEEGSKRILGDIEEKIRLAEERKQQAVAEMVESIATQTSEKLQRASAICRKEEEQAKMKSMQSVAKVELANHRRDTLIREQQEASHKSSNEKERLFRRKQKEEQTAIESKGKEIQMKLLSAAERKENLIANKVKAVKDDHQAKEIRARATVLESLNEAKELKRKSEKRLKRAAKRKQQLVTEMIGEIQDANKKKSEKVEKMNKAIELEEMQRLIATEKRLSDASANRKYQLSEKSTSAKVKLPSPLETPSSNDDLEARIEQANLRREMYLTQKVEKAKKYRNSPINKELFATVSPKQDSEDGYVGTQQFVHTIDADNEVGNNIQHGLSMPLIAISGVAVVLVALLSLLKTR